VNFVQLRERYVSQPKEVSLETLALCNAACTFCPYPTIERKGARMPDELIERLVEEMAAFELPFFFSPFKLNEPLLDQRLGPLCRMMNEHVPQARLRLFTNGSPLTEGKALMIGGLRNVEHLWISLNEHDPAKYEALMSLKFEITVKRLDALHAMAFPHPVVVSKVGPDDGFIAYVKERWPKFRPTLIKQDSWLGYVDAQFPGIPDTPCGRWFELSIMATGRVSLCCMASGDEHSIGDLNTHSLLEVYNAPHWRERREHLLSRRSIEPCNRCSY
jgi:MoaA/NifB/PqqE/SkfB family radical SAM enzyme